MDASIALLRRQMQATLFSFSKLKRDSEAEKLSYS
jgi:hypothetical protein